MALIHMKPACSVDLDKDGLGALPGADAVAALAQLPQFNQQRKRACALYNRSVSRICEKVQRAAATWEAAFAAEIAAGWDKSGSKGDADIIDALELVLYAAAEHTDDLKEVARELAGSRGENPKRAADCVERALNLIRRRISLVTNKIKHEQWRIALCRQQFTLGEITVILHGMSLTSLSHDRVGLEKLPPDDARVIALPSLLWSVIEMLYFASCALRDHVANDVPSPAPVEVKPFAHAVAAVGRLPNYSFEEEHTFKRLRLAIYANSAKSAERLDSPLYGSLSKKWDRAAAGTPGSFSFGVQGDGVTRSFHFPTLKGVTLQHWD
jgi:hypothetical protein